MAQKSSVFITAAEARHAPVRDKIVHEEARSIESIILDASSLGLFEVTVDNGTPMTNSLIPTSDVWTVDFRLFNRLIELASLPWFALVMKRLSRAGGL